MARLTICPACAAGNCDGCHGTSSRKRVTSTCRCRHGAGTSIARGTDPRAPGGSMAVVHEGQGGVLLDTSSAVLLEAIDSCRIDNPSDGRILASLWLSGRINGTTDRSAIVYVTDGDGAGQIAGAMIGLAERIGGDFAEAFHRRLALEAAEASTRGGE